LPAQDGGEEILSGGNEPGSAPTNYACSEPRDSLRCFVKTVSCADFSARSRDSRYRLYFRLNFHFPQRSLLQTEMDTKGGFPIGVEGKNLLKGTAQGRGEGKLHGPIPRDVLCAWLRPFLPEKRRACNDVDRGTRLDHETAPITRTSRKRANQAGVWNSKNWRSNQPDQRSEVGSFPRDSAARGELRKTKGPTNPNAGVTRRMEQSPAGRQKEGW